MAALTPDIPAVEATVIALTNAFRKENKLGEVRANPALTAAARAFATFLAQSDLFSHTADGRQPADRVKARGYAPCLVSENLALNLDSRGFETRALATAAVEGWKASPGHRRNMLTADATEIGVGVAKATREPKYLSVQLFGRPDKLAFTFRITNETGEEVRYAYDGSAQRLPARTRVDHTTCTAGPLAFEAAGRHSLSARYDVRATQTFVVRRAGGARVEVVVSTDGPPKK